MDGWTCTRCGECCRTEPAIAVSDAERALLEARRDGLVFQPDHRPGYWQMQAGPCPFYADGCTVYDIRPYNCRRYASLKGFTGSARDAQRVRVLYQRRAQTRWGHAHGWQP